MSHGKLQLRARATQLIAHEALTMGVSLSEAPVRLSHVIERLRPPLAALTGASGFSSLLSRALALAQREEPWLVSVHVGSSGVIGLPSDEALAGASEMADGEIALVAALLELLVTFIGAPLTLRLLKDVWPKLPFNTLEFEHEAL